MRCKSRAIGSYFVTMQTGMSENEIISGHQASAVPEPDLHWTFKFYKLINALLFFNIRLSWVSDTSNPKKVLTNTIPILQMRKVSLQ